MSVNQLEATLQAVTHTLAKLEKEGCNDEKLLSELRKDSAQNVLAGISFKGTKGAKGSKLS